MADPSTYRPRPGEIPTDPGVYRFRDKDGRVIYVGKAKNLRQRLSSYFQDLANLHPRTQTMVTSAAAVEWTVVSTEVEALQLEYSWIKEFDPRFNVRYRDDKSYPWLAVTLLVGSAFVAGPFVTAPVAMSKVEPWQGHLMPSLDTSLTVHPWCVQMAENAL